MYDHQTSYQYEKSVASVAFVAFKQQYRLIKQSIKQFIASVASVVCIVFIASVPLVQQYRPIKQPVKQLYHYDDYDYDKKELSSIFVVFVQKY